jgi:hypothetical protein
MALGVPAPVAPAVYVSATVVLGQVGDVGIGEEITERSELRK